MAGEQPPLLERIWPGAVELGLQRMPELVPRVLDLSVPEQQCWMNVLAAEREKGAPLTVAEKRRIYRGRSWMPTWKRKLADAQQRALERMHRGA